jgi:hypothetical protein
MAFPLSLQGRAFSELADVESTLGRLEGCLRDARARSVRREGEAIRFRGSFISRRFGGSVLTVISWGCLRVSRSDSLIQVEYDLHFLQNHLVRGAVTAAAFGAIYFGVATANSFKTIVAGLIFWFLLVSLDYMLAASVFPKFLTMQLKERGNDG